VPSHCVDDPPITRRRQRSERSGLIFDLPPRQPQRWQLPPDEIFSAPPTENLSLGLPPGVVDTRPPGPGVIDIRDGVQVREGVLDTRAHDVQVLIDSPVSPFEATGPLDLAEILAQIEVQETRPTKPWSALHGAAPVQPEALIETAALAQVEVSLPPAPPIADDVRRRAAASRPSPYLRRSELRRLEGRARSRSSGTSLSVPQVGIASALGLATIAAPLTGALSAPLQAGANRLGPAMSLTLVAAAPAAVVAPPFPQVAAGPVNGVDEVRLVVDDSRLSSVPSVLAAPGRILVTRASRDGSARAVLPGCDGVVPAPALSADNGHLPASGLCTLWNRKESLRADAAVSLAKLNVAYRQVFGRDLCLADGYRTLAEQYRVKALRGGYAAAPGTSEHGKGLAMDLCGGAGVARTSTFIWMRANGARYGWVNPDWAQPGGSGAYEPWHWEFASGEGSAASDELPEQ